MILVVMLEKKERVVVEVATVDTPDGGLLAKDIDGAVVFYALPRTWVWFADANALKATEPAEVHR